MAFWNIQHILNKIFDSATSALNIKVTGSLPAFAAIPVVSIDQTTPGTTNAVSVTGSSVAHDAPSTANPILTGFVAESTIPTAVADGDLSQQAGTLYGAKFVNPVTSAGAQMTGATGAALPTGAILTGASDGTNIQPLKVESGTNFNLRVGIFNGASQVTVHTAPGDGEGNFNHLGVLSRAQVFNDTTWDRWRNNTEATAISSAARTATAESAVLTNYNGRGIQVAVHASAKAAATTLRVDLLVRDSVSGVYAIKASSTAFAAVAGTTYMVDFAPGVLDADYAAGGDGRNVLVPRTYKIQVTPGDASEVTYGASVSTI